MTTQEALHIHGYYALLSDALRSLTFHRTTGPRAGNPVNGQATTPRTTG